MTNTVSRILSDETLNRIIQIESAGNPEARAGTSSAAGLGQFINGTWLLVVRKHKPELLKGRTTEQVQAMRVGIGTAALQVEMLARFTEDNAAALGAGYTDGDLYLAHFLGILDARKLLRAPPSNMASSHVSPGAVSANKSILAGKSCGEVRAWAQASMEQRWVRAGKKDWVRKYATLSTAPLPDVPLPKPKPQPQPPLTKKQTGFLAAISAAIATAGAFIEAHPIAVCGSIFFVILIFIAWRLLSKKDS